MNGTIQYKPRISAHMIYDPRTRFDALAAAYNRFLDRAGIRHAVTGASERVDVQEVKRSAMLRETPRDKWREQVGNMRENRMAMLRNELTDWFSPQQCADVLGVSKATAYQFLKVGFIKGTIQRSEQNELNETYKWRII